MGSKSFGGQLMRESCLGSGSDAEEGKKLSRDVLIPQGAEAQCLEEVEPELCHAVLLHIVVEGREEGLLDAKVQSRDHVADGRVERQEV